MSDLLETMAKDLSILRYSGESDTDFCYRVCYSASALSMLYSAKSIESGKPGISKKAQTELLQRLLMEYERCLGLDTHRFFDDSYSFITQSRRVYEETGYLLVDDRGYETVAPYGRTIYVGGGHLYFGVPDDIAFSCGLGFYSSVPGNEADLFETFLRDTLSADEYVASMFDPLDFGYRDFDQGDLVFFNPLLKKSPSSSWGSDIRTRRTVAKNFSQNTMYRVICEDDGKLLYADIPVYADKDSLASYEIRRLYFALKEQYGMPVVAWERKIDSSYYEISLSAQLPVIEYYFLLLCSWPKNNTFDRIRFITTTDMLPTIEKMLQNIGIKMIRRTNYG